LEIHLLNKELYMAVKKVKTAVIGSGMISWTYLKNMTKDFGILDVVGCSDLIPERAAHRAQQFGVKQMTNEEILSDPDIQIVVNLTYPSSHLAVTKMCLEAGKSVHTEKAMANTYAEAKSLVELAKKKGVRISCAPDTFMSGAYQTARKAIDEGWIGRPVCAMATLVRGYRNDGETPLPFNRPGGMWVAGNSMPYDMGGYYVHALIHLMGPVVRVGGFGMSCGQPYENPKNENYGKPFPATADTSIAASLEFKSGAIGTLVVLGECFGEVPRIEVYGTEGYLICPDPNCYYGPVYIKRHGSDELKELPILFDYNTYSATEKEFQVEREKAAALAKPGDFESMFPSMYFGSRRGLGVADLAWAITNKRPHRCAAEMSLQHLEIIEAVKESCEKNVIHKMETVCEQPAPLPAGFIGGAAEKALDN
jgi:predicted dehydrogenase